MRIKYGRDYYDGGMAYGIDKSIVFPRKVGDNALEIPINEMPLPEFPPTFDMSGYDRNSFGKTLRIKPIFVFFCGKLYCGLNCEYSTGYDRMSGCLNTKQSYIWSIEELEKHLSLGHFAFPEKCYWRGMKDCLTAYREYFKQSGIDKYLNDLIEKRVTIAIFNPSGRYLNDKNTWQIDNDGLKDIGFVRVLPVNTAFQELSMWFGGILPKEGEKPVKIVDENIRIDKRGFDHVTSFRKEKKNKVKK